jgi:aminoglycoside phosphotransferase (APT) family kinase protein
LLHGDYSEDNIIADNKKINAIVDFGDLVMGSPM